LQEEDVKTLPKEVFEHVDQMGAPRLVEYWEEDPCAPEPPMEVTGRLRLRARAASAQPGPAVSTDKGRLRRHDRGEVRRWASTRWWCCRRRTRPGWTAGCGQERYQIPPGAEPFLRPYVESGMKFFVAKVDPTKVTFEGRARGAVAAAVPLRQR
jgi:hypothetical protein